MEQYPGSILHWEALTAQRYESWLGVGLPELGWPARPWGFDVTGPGESDGDPLALELERDLVEVVIYDRTRPTVRGRLVTERPDGVTEIHVPVSAWPPLPWCVEIDVGWSTRAITDAVAGWLADVAGRRDLLVVTADDTDPPTTLHTLSGLVQATDVAFDDLLALDPADAAVICTALTAVADALAA